jgi:hypothetical protein
VRRIVRAISEALSQVRARFEHRDIGRSLAFGEVVRDRAAGQTAADDRDRFAFMCGHDQS